MYNHITFVTHEFLFIFPPLPRVIYASLLALAGKFDSMILPTIASSSTYEEITDSPDDSPHIVEIDSPQIMNQSQEKACITAYASGAGIGGVVGFGFKAILYDYLGLGLSVTVWSAVVFAFAYAFIYLNVNAKIRP